MDIDFSDDEFEGPCYVCGTPSYFFRKPEELYLVPICDVCTYYATHVTHYESECLLAPEDDME